MRGSISYAKNKRLLVALLILTMVPAYCRLALAQEDQITVFMEPTKPSFRMGEELDLSIEIRNNGKNGVYVGRSVEVLHDWLFSLDMTCNDEAGKKTGGLRYFPPFAPVPDRVQTFETELLKYWVALPSGGSHTFKVAIDPSWFPCLSKPGNYVFSGTYTALAMDSPVNFNPIRGHIEDIKKLSHKAWSGRTRIKTFVIRVQGTPKHPTGTQKLNL